MAVILRVDVPIASFPTSRSREYRQTYPVPPPSTVYGMLLSLVGETDRYKHCGVKIAIALLSEPAKSVTLRTMRRFKKKKLDHKENTRPDFQEILTGIELIVYIDKGEDKAKPNLCDRITEAFADPSSINRFGALCLGESRDLVNSVDLTTEIDACSTLKYLIQNEYGDLSLPYWVDYVGSKDTRYRNAKAGLILMCQSIDQFPQKVLPALKNYRSQIFLQGVSHQTTNWLSDRLGRYRRRVVNMNTNRYST